MADPGSAPVAGTYAAGVSRAGARGAHALRGGSGCAGAAAGESALGLTQARAGWVSVRRPHSARPEQRRHINSQTDSQAQLKAALMAPPMGRVAHAKDELNMNANNVTQNGSARGNDLYTTVVKWEPIQIGS